MALFIQGQQEVGLTRGAAFNDPRENRCRPRGVAKDPWRVDIPGWSRAGLPSPRSLEGFDSPLRFDRDMRPCYQDEIPPDATFRVYPGLSNLKHKKPPLLAR